MTKKSISIVGSGHTPFGRLDALNLEQLIVMAATEALEDAGVAAGDIDAVCFGNFNAGLVPDAFAASLVFQASSALRFKPATRYENACASGSAALYAGMHAIQAGAARTVLVVGAEKMTSCTTEEVTHALAGAAYKNNTEEASLSFPQQFGRLTAQYTERYSDPRLAMAQIASKNHSNAMHNPLAQMHRQVDVAFCNTVSEKNPLVADPLRLTDCSLVTDGAAAVVLTDSEAAVDFAREARLAGACQINDFLPMIGRDPMAMEGPRLAITRALEEAKINLQNLDFAEVHDCFTIAELLIYEAMGLAPSGQGHRALDDGIVFPEGSLPVNLSGGLKAKGHPVGATGVSMSALAFRQLTDRAGDMQKSGAQWGLTFNMGGMMVANYATVLEAVRA